MIQRFLDALLEALDSPSDSTSLVYLTADTAKLQDHGMCDVIVVLRCNLLDRAHLKPFALKVQTHFSRVQRGSICYDQLFTEQSERMGQHQTNPNQYSLSKGIYCTGACLRDVDYCDFLTPGTSIRHLVKGCNSRISNTTTATFC